MKGGGSGAAGQREAVGAGPPARNEAGSVAIPCKKGVQSQGVETAHPFWPLPQLGSGPLGARATMRTGIRHPHAYDGLKGNSYKIIGNQWRCTKGIHLGREPMRGSRMPRPWNMSESQREGADLRVGAKVEKQGL